MTWHTLVLYQPSNLLSLLETGSLRSNSFQPSNFQTFQPLNFTLSRSVSEAPVKHRELLRVEIIIISKDIIQPSKKLRL